MDELREMRDETEEEESGVSYARRLVQGRLDILRRELVRRTESDEDATSVGALLASLPDILSDEAGETSIGARRRPRLEPPPSLERIHRREVDRLADAPILTSLHERSGDEIGEILERFAEKERELSDLRRTLLDRIDALQGEIARRYRTGSASVADVLAPRG